MNKLSTVGLLNLSRSRYGRKVKNQKTLITSMVLRHLIVVVSLVSALVIGQSNAFADKGLPLDDPWIMFCILNSPADEIGACIDGVPPKTREIFKNKKYAIRYDVHLEPIDQKSKASIWCPKEFKNVCNYLLDAVMSIGGNCNIAENRDIHCTQP
jgi:hypothetical protein